MGCYVTVIPINSFLGTLVLGGLFLRHSAASGHCSSRTFSESRAGWRRVCRAPNAFRRQGGLRAVFGVRGAQLWLGLAAAFLSLPGLRAGARTLGVVMNFPRAASPILCAGTSLIGVRFQTPGTQHLIPLCLLAAARDTGILPKVEMSEWERETKALTSPPLPLALSNSGETLRDLKTRRLMGTLSSGGRQAAGSKSPASPVHPAAHLGCGQSTEAVGKHHPSWAG